MRKSVVGGRAWQLRAWLRVLCRWVADDAARQCGLLVRCLHRSWPRWSRMKEERSAESQHGSTGPSVVAEAAVTSADTRANSSKVRANHGANLFPVHPGSLILIHDDDDGDGGADNDDGGDAVSANLRDIPSPAKGHFRRYVSERCKDARLPLFLFLTPTLNLWASRRAVPIAEITQMCAFLSDADTFKRLRREVLQGCCRWDSTLVK